MKTILQRVITQVSVSSGFPEGDLKPETRIDRENQINMDSLDQVELGMMIEDEFCVEIPDQDFEKFTDIQSIVTYLEGRKVRGY